MKTTLILQENNSFLFHTEHLEINYYNFRSVFSVPFKASINQLKRELFEINICL